MFCTAMSVVSELISHYPGLLIGGFTLTCLVQAPIFLPTDHNLSHGLAYIYRLWIHFLFSWPWPCLSICPPSSPEPVEWKKIHCSIKIMDSWLISTLDRWSCAWDSALNNIDVSVKNWAFTILLLDWGNFKQNYLMDPNQIHLIRESFIIYGDLCQY